MAEQEHSGNIPPGWDFPEAREAAAKGCDIWALAMMQKLTTTERLAFLEVAVNLKQMLEQAGQHRLAEFVTIL